MIPVGCGWYLAHTTFSAVAEMTEKAKTEWAEIVPVSDESDLSFLRNAFSRVSQRLKTGVEELSSISKTSETLNQDVVSNAMLLSAAVKLNELLSFETDEKAVYAFIVEKVKEIFGADATFLMLAGDDRSMFDVVAASSVRPLSLPSIPRNTPCLTQFFSDVQTVIVDRQNAYRSDFREFFEKNGGIKHILLSPIMCEGEVVGLFACATFTPRMSFSGKDLETVEFFLKYVSFLRELALGSRMHQKDNDFKDALTGLYTEQFMIDRLDEELAKAKRSHKPCALVLFKLSALKDFVKTRGSLQGEAAIKKIAKVLSENLQEGEKAARCAEDTFGIVMPGLNKRRSEMAARAMLTKFKAALGADCEALNPLCSYAECPYDGSGTDELVSYASNFLTNYQPGAMR
jgi:diguanylate cyclase (GGDEF)-like protein